MSLDALGQGNLLAQFGQISGGTPLPATPAWDTGGAQLRFEDAMQAAGAGSGPAATAPVEGARLAQATDFVSVTDAVPFMSAQPPATAASATPDAPPGSAAERAIRGLELQTEVGPGQSILDGLGRLRGIFDQQIAGVANVERREVLDTTTLMNLQADVVRYTLLVDVTSKLAGKSTMALDTLMKGQ